MTREDPHLALHATTPLLLVAVVAAEEVLDGSQCSSVSNLTCVDVVVPVDNLLVLVDQLVIVGVIRVGLNVALLVLSLQP